MKTTNIASIGERSPIITYFEQCFKKPRMGIAWGRVVYCKEAKKIEQVDSLQPSCSNSLYLDMGRL